MLACVLHEKALEVVGTGGEHLKMFCHFFDPFASHAPAYHFVAFDGSSINSQCDITEGLNLENGIETCNMAFVFVFLLMIVFECSVFSPAAVGQIR